MRALAAGTLFTNEVRRPVSVTDLAAALLELAAAPHAGVCHVAGADAISRYDLGLLIASRDGLDPAGLRAATGLPGAMEVRLDSTKTQGTPDHPASRSTRVPDAHALTQCRHCQGRIPSRNRARSQIQIPVPDRTTLIYRAGCPLRGAAACQDL